MMLLSKGYFSFSLRAFIMDYNAFLVLNFENSSLILANLLRRMKNCRYLLDSNSFNPKNPKFMIYSDNFMLLKPRWTRMATNFLIMNLHLHSSSIL